jgi:BolA protein
MMNASLGPVGQEIRKRLTEALKPSHLVVSDDSAQHAGHAGHDSAGESHFSVDVVADAFAGQTRVARQRLVTYALADLLADKVHALAIKARAPGE